MAKLLKLRRGTTSQHNTFTGAEGEVTIDTTKDTAVVHDGSQAGGRPLAREDMSNVSSSSIAGRLGADAIAVTKIAGGTLPSDVKITDANVSGNLTIANADINADAVNGSKIADNSINSEHYVDGSIDRVHLAADIVDGSKIANDSINSEHYVDGSIDTAHLANDQVTFGKMQNVATQTILGRTSTGTGDISALSAANARAILNVENGATADQTAAEIRAKVEAASDSNVFTDADHNKLNGIESGATADQSASEILTAIKTVDGSGSGLDADTLDGAQPNTGASNSTIVQRTSNGYIFANYFNTTANDVTSGVTKVMVETNNDNYIRHGSAAAVRSFLNVANGATNVTNNNQLTNGAGYTTYTANQSVNTSSNPTFNQIFANDWFRVNGNDGIYWQNHGGGWQMTDSTWMRAYNSKKLYVANDIAATGNVTAYYSDERLKERTGTINDALSKVCQIETFYYKENDLAKSFGYNNGETQVGVSAQSVEKVMPEVVHLAPFDFETAEDGTVSSKSGENYKTVDYARLVPLLIESIKELKAEIDELKGGK